MFLAWSMRRASPRRRCAREVPIRLEFDGALAILAVDGPSRDSRLRQRSERALGAEAGLVGAAFGGPTVEAHVQRAGRDDGGRAALPASAEATGRCVRAALGVV
jgi:hypothetical protein